MYFATVERKYVFNGLLALPCVSVNNLPASFESTLVYYIREFNFKKELKYSSTEDRGCYPFTCHGQRAASATVRCK